MRQKRAKAYKKQMVVYLHTFKFREPYQTIVDAELVLTCSNASFEIDKGLNRTVQGETKPMITQCCMQALYDSKNQQAIDLAKSFERRKCNHREAIDPDKCIESITNIDGENKHRYIVASQSIDLRRLLRKIPGVPLIYMNRSVMVMEPLSDASAKFSERFERKKLTKGLNDAKFAGKPIEEEQKPEKTDEEGPSKKKRKGPKGPNPLSVKKKKPDSKPESNNEDDKPKKRRRHKKKGGDGSEEAAAQNGEQKEHNESTSAQSAAKETAQEYSTTGPSSPKDSQEHEAPV